MTAEIPTLPDAPLPGEMFLTRTEFQEAIARSLEEVPPGHVLHEEAADLKAFALGAYWTEGGVALGTDVRVGPCGCLVGQSRAYLELAPSPGDFGTDAMDDAVDADWEVRLGLDFDADVHTALSAKYHRTFDEAVLGNTVVRIFPDGTRPVG